jgi:glycosyltransferase involved in cell wall biosynthesis
MIKRIVQINTFPYKATGNIMMNIHKALIEAGMESYVVWGRGRKPENDKEISMEDSLGIKLHGAFTRVSDRTGFASKRATRQLIQRLENIKPDIVHLHNIHGYYINIELLLDYLKRNQIKIIWTLHDCWAFTGHCAFFDAVGCEKWQKGCHNCEQLATYPKSMIMDSSTWNWRKKKELFTGADIRIITPSHWLDMKVKESFLKDCPVEVIHNGIDTTVFKYRESDFRHRKHIEDKIVVLGVASEWTKRKGLDDFIRLELLLKERGFENCKIVLIGLDKDTIKEIPDSMIGLERTSNVQELVEMYSTADVFFNPTYEDNFPTTNLEALACGTPVVTYRTGGSPECINDQNGIIIDKGCVAEFADMIINAGHFGKLKKEVTSCLGNEFNKKSMIDNYIKLYQCN